MDGEPTFLRGCFLDEIVFVASIGLTLPAQAREGCSRW